MGNATLKMKKNKVDMRISTILIYGLMLCLILIILIPIINLVAKSLSSPEYSRAMSGWDILPKGFTLSNYEIIFDSPIIWRATLNSVVITVCGTFFSMLLTSCAAYALTRPGLPGKSIFMVFLLIMMIFEPTTIQYYMVVKGYNLIDKIGSMIIFCCVNVYYLILLMRFFAETPQSLLEAARIDGAGEMTTLFRIFLPLNRVPLITLSMFYAVDKWNEYFYSSIFLTSSENTVLQVFLKKFAVDGDSWTYLSHIKTRFAEIDLQAVKAAAIVVVILPILLLYPLILKYFTSGVLIGSVKE